MLKVPLTSKTDLHFLSQCLKPHLHYCILLDIQDFSFINKDLHWAANISGHRKHKKLADKDRYLKKNRMQETYEAYLYTPIYTNTELIYNSLSSLTLYSSINNNCCMRVSKSVLCTFTFITFFWFAFLSKKYIHSQYRHCGK